MRVTGSVNANTSPFFSEAFRALSRQFALPTPRVESHSNTALNTFDNRNRYPDFLAEFKDNLRIFQRRLSSSAFLGDAFSFRTKTAVVNDQERLLARASIEAEDKEYSFTIDRLARTREIVSRKLASAKTTELAAGTYGFNLTVGDASYSLELEVDRSANNPDSNLDLFRKLQSSINQVDPELEASVSQVRKRVYSPYAQDVFEKVSYLSVRNKSTGAATEFSLTDTSGELIAELGLDKARQAGRDNLYSVNGAAASSGTDNIVVDGGRLSATLLVAERNMPVKVSVREDVAALDRELRGVIESYNTMINWLDDNRRFVSGDVKRLLLQEAGLAKTGNVFSPGNGQPIPLQIDAAGSLSVKLSELGIGIKVDGTLKIEQGFSSSLLVERQTVYETLAGDQGLFTKIGQAVENILSGSVDRFVLAKSTFLSYGASGGTASDISRRSATQFLDLYA